MKQYLLVLLLPLAGCASSYMWAKNGATQAEYTRDLSRCRYEAASATASYGSSRGGPTMSSAIAQGLGEGMAIGIRQSDLMVLCLEAKGYTKHARGEVPPPYAPMPAPSAAPPPATLPATVAVKDPDNAEISQVTQVLADDKFPLVGTPTRIMHKGNLTYYQAWGAGGRLTQVVCSMGSCRMRTIYD